MSVNNLLSCPGFETPTTDWILGGVGTGASTIDPTPHAGTSALKITNPSAGNYGTSFNRTGIPLLGAVKLYVSVFAKGSAGGVIGPIRITFANVGASINAQGIASSQPSAQASTAIVDWFPVVTTGYVLYHETIVVPAGYTWAFLECYNNGAGVVLSAFVDDFDILYPQTNVLGSALSALGNVVLGGVQRALRFGAGGAGPPPINRYFSYRVYDPVSGALVIANLPHPHRSKWTIRAVQPGNVGSTSVGDFEIPLYAPSDDSYRKSARVYALLAEGQRIEGYEAPAPDIEAGGGVPVLSGVIRGLPSALADNTIKGVDSLFLLQASRTQRTEFFSGRTDQLKDFALRAYQLTYADDFVSASLAAYTQTGPLAWSAANDEGLPVATVTGDSSAAPSMLTTGNFAQSTYVDCILDNYFRMAFATNVNVQHGLVAAAAGAFWVLGYLDARFVVAGKWEVDLIIATVASGVITKRVTKTLVVVEPTPGMRGQLSLIGKQGTYNGSSFIPSAVGPDYLWRLTLNGVDAGCTWIQMGVAPSGGVGFLYNSGAAPAGGPQLWATQLVFMSRLAVMQPGITNVGARSILQYTPRTAMLDLLNYASVTEGFLYRKNPGVGLNQDVLDWGPAAGTALAGQTAVGSDSLVRFVFGKNLMEYAQEANADALATDIAMTLSPSGDHAGVLNWHMIAAMRKYGIITDTVQAQYLADFLSARALAQVIGATKSSPGVSKKFKVLRDPETAGLFRELDYVVVHHPEYRKPLINQRVQIVERIITEGSPFEELTGDSFPATDLSVELGRMWQTLDQIAVGSSNVTPSSVGTGLVYDSRFGSPQVLPFYGPYLSVDPSNNYRFRFSIPANVVVIQKITLAFSLLPYRTYSSFTISATGGANVGHTHTVGAETGHTHNHGHNMALGAGGVGGTVNMVAPNGPLQLSAGGPLTDTTTIVNDATGSSGHNHGTTSSHSVNHTHTVSGSSALGIAEGAVAQGVTVLIDGVDVTALLATAGPYGSGTEADFGEFDITPYVLGGGWHEIQFTSTTLGAMVAQGMMYVIVKPTGA